MTPYTLISAVDYIQLLHKGKPDRSLYDFYSEELNTCSPMDAAIAIDNLFIRYKHIADLERTTARFIRAVSSGLDAYPKTEYMPGSIFKVLERENEMIKASLLKLKRSYMGELANLKRGDGPARSRLMKEIETLKLLQPHYRKLQYGVFSALEYAAAPARCTKLMWHLQDSVWPMRKECLKQLESVKWDYTCFNKTYGQMYYLVGTLVYREEKILFPVVHKVIPEKIQISLVREVASHGIVS